MSDNRLYVASKVTTLAAGSALGATTLTPSVIQDREGNSIGTMATYWGTKAYGVISPGKDREEHFTFTGISSGVLTGVSHITMVAPYTETSGLNEAHSAGEVIVLMTNAPGFYNDFANKQNDETIVGTYTFNELPTLDTYEAPTNSAQFAPKGYVDSVALGTTTVDKLIVAGTAGETVAAGNLVYFDTGTNNEWMKCDADTAGSVDNVLLGIAQGAGTDGNTISGGVLLKGLDTNQSGMTQGDPMYASNTAGAISSSAGTTEVVIGAARSSTTLYFDPRFAQQITEAQQDLLDAITASASEINITDGLTATTAQLNEAGTFFGATDITGAEAETLSSGPTSDADALHTHTRLVQGLTMGYTIAGTGALGGTDYPCGFSDATTKVFALGAAGGGSASGSLGAFEMDATFKQPFVFATGSGLTKTKVAGGVLAIGSNRWSSTVAGGGFIQKDGSDVTISGTARNGPLGHNPTTSSLLVLYSTTKIAQFSGIAGTTITNLDTDITLDTAVTATVGFLYDNTNSRYICLDTTANLIRRFNSTGTTIDTLSYTLTDSRVVGLISDGYRVYIVVQISSGAEAGGTASQGNGVIIASAIPTSMTI